ncbi:hypothetical protein CCHR01_03054 [Colletotrichum chrysophilum]|uniref:Secreted protein n=1 Tax=Colletotrichum chrysophilum TaxID=1836956 RepID=A0AAD9EJS3_9PEZI|nr:hypothetical protein CCHR01_03054 [Colletotrichum chrysophilum]
MLLLLLLLLNYYNPVAQTSAALSEPLSASPNQMMPLRSSLWASHALRISVPVSIVCDPPLVAPPASILSTHIPSLVTNIPHSTALPLDPPMISSWQGCCFALALSHYPV